MSKFSSKIKAKRKELGISMPTLARLSGVHSYTIWEHEKGWKASDKTRWLLIKTLNIPFNDALFSEKIRKKRESLGWTVSDLGQASKVSGAYICQIENKKKLPSALICYKLAKVLNLKLEYFI